MEKTENAILEQPIWRALWGFFVPCWLGMLFQQLYNTADTLIISKFVGTGAVAAVGNVSVAVALIIGICVSIAGGAGVVISQNYGAGKHKAVLSGIRCALNIAIIGGAVLTVICVWLAEKMVLWMDTPADILSDSVTYLRVYFCALIPNLIYNFGTAILRGMGDSKRPLYILTATSILNIVLDVIFVVVLHWDVFGVALATDLSQILSAVLVLWLLVRREPELLESGIDEHTYQEIFRLGLPAAFQSLMYSSSNVLIQVAINGFQTAAIAAWSIYGKVDCVCWMTMSSMGLAVTAFAGQNFGAGYYDRVKRSAWVSSGMLAGALVVLVALCWIFARPMFAAFNDDREVISIGVQMMRFLSPAYMLYFLIETLPGVLRGCGDVLIPTIASIIGICLVRVLWIFFVVPAYHTILTVEMSYVVTWSITTVFYLVYFARGNWLKRCIDRKGMAA